METVRAAVTQPMVPDYLGIVVGGNIANGTLLDPSNGNTELTEESIDLCELKSVSVFVRKQKGNWNEEGI